MEALEPAGPPMGGGVWAWCSSPRAVPLADEPAAQVESEGLVKGKGLPPPSHSRLARGYVCPHVPGRGWQWGPAAPGRDTYPAGQASSSDVSQELGTESREVPISPQHLLCLGIAPGDRGEHPEPGYPQHVLGAAGTRDHCGTSRPILCWETPTAPHPGHPRVLVPCSVPPQPLLCGLWGAETPLPGVGAQGQRGGADRHGCVPHTSTHSLQSTAPRRSPRAAPLPPIINLSFGGGCPGADLVPGDECEAGALGL